MLGNSSAFTFKYFPVVVADEGRKVIPRRIFFDKHVFSRNVPSFKYILMVDFFSIYFLTQRERSDVENHKVDCGRVLMIETLFIL